VAYQIFEFNGVPEDPYEYKQGGWRTILKLNWPPLLLQSSMEERKEVKTV